MMSRRGDSTRVYNIAVVGLSGTEKDKGQIGIGKSCLCNRFVRSRADDYFPEHISVLSVTDFSGRVVNNDHFLYWGYSTKAMEDSPEIGFHLVEQTEFIDDATFQPFKGGKMEPYTKRCASSRVYSAEKLMYICKSQLGIEKEYEQKVMPDGRLNIDGFILCYDVSAVPDGYDKISGRSIDRQTDFSAAILYNITRTKKPVVLVTTKNDEACEAYVKEAEKLVQRKEFRQLNIPVVETSSHDNVNVDVAFLLLAQLIDKVKNRIRPLSYNETARNRKDMLDSVSDSFQALIQSHVTDHRSVWTPVYRELLKYPAFQRYIELFGEDCAQRLFRRHLKRLKDEFLSRRERRYLEKLPEILQTLFPDQLPENQSWDMVLQRIKEHPECALYFVVAPSGLAPETDWTWGSESSTETNIRENRDLGRIPLDLLNLGEAETIWRNLVNSLQQDRKRGEYRQQFKFLLDNTPYVTPGKSLNELQVLFMGHECFEALTGQEIQAIYEQHQIELIEKAKRAFVELMLEHAEVFAQVRSDSSPMATITQQQVREIFEILQEDSRYKALDRLDQERRLMLLQHLGFVHCPQREHCPSYPNCMDSMVERILESAPKVTHFNNGNSNNLSTDAVLTLYLIGSPDLVDAVRFGLEEQCEEDEYELDGVVYTVDLKCGEIPGTFPSNTSGHLQSRLVIYSSAETLDDTKAYLEKTLLSNLAAEENGPLFAEPPVVIVFNAGHIENLDEREMLSNEGQSLADSLGCGFVDVSGSDGQPSTQLLAEALQSLVRSLRDRVNPNQPPFGTQVVLAGQAPDICIIMCMFCGDSYNVGSLIAPLFTLPAAQQTDDRAISLLTFLGDRRRCVQIMMSSYHGAASHRESLIHGLILVYSASRKASFKALKAFSSNVPNLPIQVLAVTENGGASTMFGSSLGQKLITDGNALADELRGHFATWSGEHTVGIYTPFFRQVWDQKSDIEKAFRMESPPLYRAPPAPSRRPPGASDGNLASTNDSDDIYEQLPSGGDSDGGGSEDALVKPSWIRNQRQQQQQQGPKPKLEPSASDNCVMKDFDNLWSGARRSQRDLGGTGVPNAKSQQPYLAFATGRRSHHSSRSLNNNGMSTQVRQHGHATAVNPGGGGHGNNVPGRINMAEYTMVTDALSRMRLPRTSPPYSNLNPNDDYVSDTASGRNRSNRARRNPGRLPPPPSDSSSSASPVSDPEDFSRPKHKKKSLKGTNSRSRHHPSAKPKAIFAPIPTVPKGFVPYQLSGDSGVFSGLSGSRTNKSLTMDEGSASSPVDVEKKPFARLKEEMSNLGNKNKDKSRKKEKPPKKLTKSKSTEQQPQTPPNFGTSLEEASSPGGILERCVKFIEDEGLEMEGLYRVPGNRAHVEALFARLAEEPNTDLHSLDIPVNAVATALKDFLAKRLPPPFPTDMMMEVERVALISDRSLRLLELKQFLRQLPSANFNVLRIVFSHLVRVSERSRINAMDSKNLAICWWPTLLPFSFADMLVFERMRPHLEDLVQTMIDQFPFLFCGKEDVVMV
ncbi:rho GTPase-activating protein 190 isoform X2 [Folsomia candida]|uniref:rho GTPase-activating protein 190 isoform X2 n=1 Tax=Folsomia candida TaxID=158441 RepID=UPI001604DF6D|nr:rho GTPase-activating protein 190 isoform X2 [Folsomia candida]